jgi:Helix-turn-helix
MTDDNKVVSLRGSKPSAVTSRQEPTARSLLRCSGNGLVPSNTEYWRQYGVRLRTTRLALGISEKEAASAYQVTLRTYRRYENGQRQRGCVFSERRRAYPWCWIDTGLPDIFRVGARRRDLMES